MFRHVFSIIGYDEEHQSKFNEIGSQLHQSFQDEIPGKLERGQVFLCRHPEKAEECFIKFLEKIKQSIVPGDDPNCQIVIYYVGHGKSNGSDYHLGLTTDSPLLAPIVSRAFVSYENKLAFSPSIMLLVDACESGHIYTQGILHKSVPYIRQATSNASGLSFLQDGEPIFSKRLHQLLSEGVTKGSSHLEWMEIYQALKNRFAGDTAIRNAPEPNSSLLSTNFLITKNRRFDRDVMERYLNHLIETVATLPGFMRSMNPAEDQSIDFRSLRQPIYVTRGLQGNPIPLPDSITQGEDSETPSQESPNSNQQFSQSDSVLRVQWDISILEENPFLAIVGEPGCGKSWLACHAVFELSQKLLADLKEGISPADLMFRLPIYGLLRNLSYEIEDEKPIDRLLRLLVKPNDKHVDRLLKSVMQLETGFLILDGLDEIKSAHSNVALAELTQFAGNHSSRHVCLLCREQSYRNLREIQKTESEPVIVRILPLHRLDVHQFIRKFLSLDTTEAISVFDSLLERNLVSNPLILAMACIAYRDRGPESIRNFTNRSQILQTATWVILKNWSSLRTSADSDLTTRSIEQDFRSLAALAVQTFLNEQDLTESLKKDLYQSPSLIDSGLLSVNLYGTLQFSHRSIEEYMAAEGLLLKYENDQNQLISYIERLSWRAETHTVIFDVSALSNLGAEFITRFADKATDSTSRHRLRLAALLLGSCPPSSLPVTLTTEIIGSIILIYCRSLKIEIGYFGNGLPDGQSIAADWLPAIRSILRTNPQVFSDSILDLLSHQLCDEITMRGNDDDDFYLELKLEGSRATIVSVLLQKACDIGDFEQSLARHQGVRAAAAVLLAEPEHLTKAMPDSVRLIKILAKEGNRGLFNIHWKLLTPTLLSNLGKHDAKLLVKCCLTPSTGWRMLTAFKEGASPEVAQMLTTEIEASLDPNSSDYTGLGYALFNLKQAGASSPALHFKILDFMEQRVSRLRSSSWAQIRLDTQELAFGINALQDFVWSLWNDQQPEEIKPPLPMERMLTFLTHQDFRIRAVSGKCLRASKFEWEKNRSILAFTTLDRLRFHEDTWSEIHFDEVKPQCFGNDWLPESVNPDTWDSTHDKLLWDVFAGDLAILKKYPEIGQAVEWNSGDLKVETVMERSPLEFPQVEFDPSSLSVGNKDLVSESLRQTFYKFANSCPTILFAELSQLDFACVLPLIYAVFQCSDQVAQINATLQLGLLLGTKSLTFQLAVDHLFKSENDYETRASLQRLADTVTWFTPNVLPERLQRLQNEYDNLRTSLAERIGEKVLQINNDREGLFVSILQMPLSRQMHYEVVRKIWFDSLDTVARFQSFSVRHLAIACRRGMPDESDFMSFLERTFPDKSKDVMEHNPISNKAKGIVGIIHQFSRYDKLLSHQELGPEYRAFSRGIFQAFSVHPKSHEFCQIWRNQIGTGLRSWTSETKLFVRFTAEVNQNSAFAPQYRDEIRRLLDKVMKSHIVPQLNLPFIDDDGWHGWTDDVSALLSAMTDGYRPANFSRVRKGIPHRRKNSWIFSSGSRFLRHSEALGYRYFLKSNMGTTFLERFLGSVITWSPPVIFIVLGSSLHWQFSTFTALIEEQRWVMFALIGIIVLQGQAAKLINLSSNVPWSTVDELDSVQPFYHKN